MSMSMWRTAHILFVSSHLIPKTQTRQDSICIMILARSPNGLALLRNMRALFRRPVSFSLPFAFISAPLSTF